MVKQCTKCKRELADEEFHWNGARLKTQCKACIGLHVKNYNQTERGKTKHREYVTKNKDRIKTYMANYYKKNKARYASA